MRVVRPRALLLAGPAALVLAAAVACGSSYSSSSPAPTSPSPGTTSSAPSTPGTSSAALMVTDNPSLGKIVTTGSGLTVYRFDADTSNPPMSNCNGGCVKAWPPVLVAGSGTPQVKGVSASLVGELTRSDGTKQLTIAGWPMYTYAGDSGPGTTAGQGNQGFGAAWWAVTPTGAKAASGSGTMSSSPSSTGSSGY